VSVGFSGDFALSHVVGGTLACCFVINEGFHRYSSICSDFVHEPLYDNQEGSIFFKIGKGPQRYRPVIFGIGKGEAPISRNVLFQLSFHRYSPSTGKLIGNMLRCTFFDNPNKSIPGECISVPRVNVSDFVPLSTVSRSAIPTPIRIVKSEHLAARYSSPPDQERQDNGTDQPFHLITLSSDTSTGSVVSERTMETNGDRLFLSRDGAVWYELIRSGK